MHTNTVIALKSNFMRSFLMSCISLKINFLQSLLKFKNFIMNIPKDSLSIFLVLRLYHLIPCSSCPRRHLHKTCSHLIASHCSEIINLRCPAKVSRAPEGVVTPF